MMLETGAKPQCSVSGVVSAADKAYASGKIMHIVQTVSRPVLNTHVRLMRSKDPAHERPAVAEATLDVDGRIVRAMVAMPTMHEAIDALEARLCRQLRMLSDRAESRRLRHFHSGSWHHGDSPTYRPSWFDRPVEDRVVVRRKTFAIHEMLPDEAAFEMELLGHDFYLFTELNTGADCVVYCLKENRYDLLSTGNGADAVIGSVTGILDGHPPAPRLTEAEAIELLNASDQPFVFFVDAITNVASALYRRYDGHYGLVTSTHVGHERKTSGRECG